MTDVVALTWREVRLAALGGIDRHIYAASNGFAHRYGAESRSPWDTNIVGALGEWATAKALGRYPDGFDYQQERTVGDVGRLQVRSRSRSDGNLVVHLEDPDAAAFVLVVPASGRSPRFLPFRVVGWIYGAEAKDPRYLSAADRPGGQMFFVPQAALHPLDHLPPDLLYS